MGSCRFEWFPNWDTRELKAYVSTSTKNISYAVKTHGQDESYTWVASKAVFDTKTLQVSDWQEIIRDGSLVSVLKACQLNYDRDARDSLVHR